MPLPPSSSRAHATVSRHLAVVKALASEACASVILPSASNWDMRTRRHCEAVMLASIFARRSCTIWNEPIGLPNCKRSWLYLSAFSYAPIAHPVASHATMKRVIFKTLAVSRKELSAWRRFSSGTRQFSMVIKPFWTTLSAILFWIFSTLKPVVVLFSIMKDFTWLSARSRAQMIEMSHHGELPIHFFWPLRIHVSPSRFAVVVRPPEAPEPTRGSVSPKQPILSQRAIGGSHFCFCSSEPPR